MAEDLEITGATTGDISYVVAYYDVTTNNLYNANGQLYGNSTFSTTLGNEFILELHYVQDISTSENPEEWAVWDGLKDMTVSSTVAFDDNYLHAVRGTIVADAEAGSPSVSVDVTDEINKDTLSRYGVLLVNPFGDEEDQLMIPYSSFEQVSGTTFSFIVDDAQGLEASVTKDSPVRVSDPLYMFINANDIYEANIPNRYEEGVFKFPVNVMSRKLLNALDYSGSAGVSGTMEHKIYANKTNVVGLKNKSFTPPMPLDRNQDIDEVASLREFVGIKTTGGADMIYTRGANSDITNDGTAYYAWLNDGGGVAFYTKTQDVAVGTLLYDETFFTQLTDTVSELVYEVNPYLFCGWNSGILKYWTKGNDVKENDYFYNISGGTATVGTASASPVYEAEPVLFRTFAFPFIVRNLVDYGVSLTIPTEDIDWTKEYIISIIRNNMEEVNGKASEGAYGVVMIDGSTDSSGVHNSNIHVSDGVISVPNASTTTRGAIQIATGEEVTTGTDTSKAVVPFTLKTELDKKQDNLTFDTTTGIEVVSGTTVKNDIATVEEVLTGATGTNIVDADGLTGALSLGQAVDVSCPPTAFIPANISLDGGSTWTAFSQDIVDAHYLDEICYDFTGYASNPSLNFTPFPKYGANLSYLLRFDIKNLGSASLQVSVYKAPKGTTSNQDVRILDTWFSDSAYHRINLIVNTKGFYIVLRSSSAVKVGIKDLRQYEVTHLTDDAIAYLAQLETPDEYFRSNTIDTVKNKYLVKNDMVCPWIKTISMPDNSDLTVASGLAYKIKYTNDSPHTITADTIPADAYGQDAHIKMFIKGTSAIHFTEPLVLMNALTPNAGHNISVKFRDGQAFVYVDDTDAGYVVTVASGNTNGTLNYAITGGTTDYAIFSADLDGTVVDAGTATFVGTSENTTMNILGNGTDETTITGNISVNASRALNLQSLAIAGGTLGGAGTIAVSDIAITAPIERSHVNGFLAFSGTNVINSTVGGVGMLSFADGTVLTSTNGQGVFDRSSGQGYTVSLPNNSSMSNIIITGKTEGSYAAVFIKNTGSVVHISNCLITNNKTTGSGFGGGLTNENNTTCYITGSTFSNNSAPSGQGGAIRWNPGYLEMTDCIVTGSTAVYGGAFRFSSTRVYLKNCTVTGNVGTGAYQSEGSLMSVWCGAGPSYITVENCMTDGTVYTDDGDAYITMIGNNSFTSMYSLCYHNTSDRTFIRFVDGSTTTIGGIARRYNGGTVFITIGNCSDLYDHSTWVVGGSVTFITSGGTATISGCEFTELTATGMFKSNPNIVVGSMELWGATNAIFGSPLDAAKANTIKLSGTTFATTAKTLNANRIQLPASTTVSFQGNTNPADTKILDASLIVVGDNPASPFGSATVVNASGTSSTVTGIGTYIDKEGDNDFVALNKVVAVDTDSAFATALTADTQADGTNRFIELATGSTVTASYSNDTTITDKNIITHDYEPIIYGSIYLKNSTVSDIVYNPSISVAEDTKTLKVESGYMQILSVVRGSKDAVLDLNHKYNIQVGGATISDLTIMNGEAPSDSNGGSAFYVINSSGLVLNNCIIMNNHGSAGAVAVRYDRSAYVNNCLFVNNTSNRETTAISVRETATVYISGSTFMTNQVIGFASDTAVIELSNYNKTLSTIISGSTYTGNLYLKSNSTLDLTGNTNTTPINPGGAIIIGSSVSIVYDNGGNGTVKTSILGGTCTVDSISNDGVLQKAGNFQIGGGTYTNAFFKSSGGYSCNIKGDVTFDNTNWIKISGNPQFIQLWHEDDGVKIEHTLTLKGTCNMGYIYNIGGISDGVSRGTLVLSDNAVLDIQGQSYSKNPPIRKIATVIVGSGVRMYKGGTNYTSITGGTYHNCTIDGTGNITEA